MRVNYFKMELKNQPLVTVYIPTYNRVELLKRAVKSVRDQTYQNLEIIIVDDCSTDGTHEYLAQLGKEDSRVRYFLKEKNSGACASRNIAIENANGEFITGLDDDDYFLDRRIEWFLNKWDGKSLFLYAINIVKDQNGLNKPNFLKRLLFKNKIFYKDLRIANYPGNQIFSLTKNLKNIGGFDENMPAWQDMEMWYRLLKEYNSYGKRVNKQSYICDVSHNHERITNLERHKLARSIFIEKHNLSSNDASLYFQVEAHKLSVLKLINRMINQFSIIDLYYLMKKLKR